MESIYSTQCLLTLFFSPDKHNSADKICIFGFSRGAYTARALAGLIEKVGLLPAGNHQQVPFAYKMYMKDDEEGMASRSIPNALLLTALNYRMETERSICKSDCIDGHRAARLSNIVEKVILYGCRY